MAPIKMTTRGGGGGTRGRWRGDAQRRTRKTADEPRNSSTTGMDVKSSNSQHTAGTTIATHGDVYGNEMRAAPDRLSTTIDGRRNGN